MNKKLYTAEILGGMGVLVMNTDNSSSLWHNGENLDVVKTTTNIQIDQSYLLMQISNHLTMLGPKLVEDQLDRLIKDKIRFDMVSWLNDDGLPEVTCQLFYGDKLIGEKTTHTTSKGTENVASPT